MQSAAQNVDPAELAKFSALAQSWWDPNGPSKPLHDLNPLRLQYVERAASLSGKQASSTSVAAAASCPRRWRAAARACWASTFREPCSRWPSCTQLEAKIAVDYRVIAAEELARERPAAFDVVTCMEMLEHVPDPAAALRCARRSGETRRRCHRLDLESQSAGVRRRDRRRRIYRACAAARHARVPEIHPSFRTRALGTGGGPRTRRSDRHHLQPADASVSTVAEHQVNYLAHFRRGAVDMTRRRCARSCSTWTAHCSTRRRTWSAR